MPQITREDVRVPADVMPETVELYIDNYMAATRGTGRLMLFACDQKIEHLNKDFHGEGIDPADGDPEHLFQIGDQGTIGVLAGQRGLIAQYARDYPNINYLVKMNSKTNLVGTKQEDPYSPQLYDLDAVLAMKEAGVKKLVFSSSAATYGVPPVDVVPEDVEPMVPINPYGQTKLFGEWMARACEQPYGIRFCGLRYFNVAGCGPVQLEDPAILNLIPMLFDRLKQGKAPAIFGDDYPTPDGTCVRDYIHVSDLADAHIAALKYLDRDERKYDVFNVGTGEGTSVRQIVDEVKKVTGLPFKETVMGRRAGDPPHLIGSPERINTEMGWHAKYDVEDIVESAWNAWQANPDHHIDVETWKQTD
mgnify:CR=1 FL=1